MDNFNLFKIFELDSEHGVVNYNGVRFLSIPSDSETDVCFQPLIKIYCIHHILNHKIVAYEIKVLERKVYNRGKIELANIPDNWVVTTDFNIIDKIDYACLA